ncbi:hypothetical protein HPB50_013848 [Hyalomma asiaticum]|uniref:Uncharacterized protein n=1 Tax=Hyalomma asiaticum TaxID=266040 RepID=A0ACB7RQV8_HYAAI|nr:hypothetical protein HPB50_013848 [Hyalomma asiaticum]
MAPRLQRYKLSGFSQELDWKTVHFAEAIPAERICDGCGWMPKDSIRLPCSHVLCTTCHEQCLVGRGCECPLDRTWFSDEYIEKKELLVGDLLRFQNAYEQQKRRWKRLPDNGEPQILGCISALAKSSSVYHVLALASAQAGPYHAGVLRLLTTGHEKAARYYVSSIRSERNVRITDRAKFGERRQDPPGNQGYEQWLDHLTDDLGATTRTLNTTTETPDAGPHFIFGTPGEG